MTREESIFAEALGKRSGAERDAYMEEACANEADLRREVMALLRAHEQAEGILESPPADLDATSDTPPVPSHGVGSTIGPYKLLEQIGGGGMGVVFMAEQVRPVRRKVALKVIKPGMDSGQVIARFEAERQALTMMDHPNIARVLDAGTTDAGRPYFVMELVKGVPITDYCDQARLDPRLRLNLFVQVCNAVQHAHQKGVIHRDLKPGNVLVTLHDDKPVPKVIDFGIAKATGQQLTERTLFTNYAQMLGTPLYMSPEQAQLSGLDVDTRSDVYSLGVLLYELLTGTTPFDKQRLREAAYDEMRRIIREEEPPKPSTRLSSMADRIASVSAQRDTEPRKLGQLVRGELDWIVMKSLEKDRTRRYETAIGLGRDVERYLADEPVQACPPSARYRLGKFARRNKRTVVAASLIMATLIAGMVGTTIGLVHARNARQAETEQRQLAQANEQKALAAAAAEKRAKQIAQAREAESRAVLDFVENKVFAAAGPEGEQGGLGREVTLRQAIEAALPFVETSFPKQPKTEASLRTTLGIAFFNLGEADKAAEQFQKARALYNQCLGPVHPATLMSMSNVANCLAALGRNTEALQLREETLALQKAKLGPEHPNTLQSAVDLAASYRASGRYADALKLGEQTMALMKVKLGPDHPDTLRNMVTLANLYEDHGRHADALALREPTLALLKVRFGPDHPVTLTSMNNLANSYGHLGRLADALKLHEETLALQSAKLGPDHPDTLRSMYNLASTYYRLNRRGQALRLYEVTVALYTAKLGPDHPDTLGCVANLAFEYAFAGRHADALKLRQETLALEKARLGPDHPDTLDSMCGVASSLVHLDRSAEAMPIIDECLKRAEGKAVDPDTIRRLVSLRLRHFQRAKDAAGCRATAEMYEKLQRTDPGSLYDAACHRSVTAAVVKQDPKTPVADASRLAGEDADRAMAWLKQAVAAGYSDVRHMKHDADLEALREREEFKELLAELDRKLLAEPKAP